MGNPGPSESGFHFLQDAQRCWRYFYNKYILELKPIKASPAVIYGGAMHEAMEYWYKNLSLHVPVRVRNAKKVFAEYMNSSKSYYELTDRYDDDMHRGLKTLESYALHTSMDNIKVIATEILLEHTLPNGFVLTGRLDLVVQNYRGAIEIWDHKTTGWSIKKLKDNLKISDQANCYLLLWNSNNPDRPANEVTYNILRNYKGSIEFDKLLLLKTNRDVEEFEQSACDTFNDIMYHINDENYSWRKNTDNCMMYNRMCEYSKLCHGSNFAGLHTNLSFNRGTKSLVEREDNV